MTALFTRPDLNLLRGFNAVIETFILRAVFGNSDDVIKSPIAHFKCKRDFLRTLTPAVLTTGFLICSASGVSGSGGFGEVEWQQVGHIGVGRALRQFGEDVAQPCKWLDA
jgi:hypothetical protein